MALINSSVVDIAADVALATSKPNIKGNDDKLLANDVALDARIVTLEAKIYGELFAIANGTANALTTQNTWYKYVSWTNVGATAGTTISLDTDDIICPTAGVYRISFNASFNGSLSETFELAVFKNEGATELTNIHIERALGTGGDIGAVAASGIVTLTANDKIELWVRCLSGASKSITIKDANMNLVKL